MTETGVCHYLDWDSQFFGCRIARAMMDEINEQSLERIRDYCAAQRIDCLYFLAKAADPETILHAENAGFHLVDARITLEWQLCEPLPPAPDETCLRLSRLEDIPALEAIARVSHHDTRFYNDKNFSRPLCDALYETWIRNSVNGYAEAVFVADFQGLPAGYLSCHLPSPAEAQIGLFAVSEQARGKGLGRQLVEEALRWFAISGASRVKVVTQGRNVAAQHLYQRCGFVTQSRQLWYHYWPHEPARGCA